MMTYDNFCSTHFKRDISLYEFLFEGQKPEQKSEVDEYERFHGQLKAWDILAYLGPLSSPRASRDRPKRRSYRDVVGYEATTRMARSD